MKMFPVSYTGRDHENPHLKMLNLLRLAALLIISIADSALTGVGEAFDDITHSE